jgi:hypothetical protein
MALRHEDTPYPGQFATKLKGGRPRIHPNIEARIRERAVMGWSAPAIWRELEDAHVVGRPALRTVQRVVRELQLDTDSAPWSLLDADFDEAELVPPVLAAIILVTSADVSTITRAEAAAVARVRRAAPTLDLYASFLVARLYLVAQEHANDRLKLELDLYLGLQPWRSQELLDAYERTGATLGFSERSPFHQYAVVPLFDTDSEDATHG